MANTHSPAIESITFDQLVQHGFHNGGNIVNGMPWSFTYKGVAVTHENDDCYLILVPGANALHMTRKHALVTLPNGRLIVCEAPGLLISLIRLTTAICAHPAILDNIDLGAYEDALEAISKATGEWQ